MNRVSMSVEENRALVRRLYEDGLEQPQPCGSRRNLQDFVTAAPRYAVIPNMREG